MDSDRSDIVALTADAGLDFQPGFSLDGSGSPRSGGTSMRVVCSILLAVVALGFIPTRAAGQIPTTPRSPRSCSASMRASMA